MKKYFISMMSVLLMVSFCDLVSAEPPPDPHPGATMPTREQNLDPDGYIAVHEQGIADVYVTGGEMDVNITNSSLEVTGTVSVENFPATQDVFVTGGDLDATIPPAATAEVLRPTLFEAGEMRTINFQQVVNATTIAIWDSSVTGDNDPEVRISILSPLNGGGTLFEFPYEDGVKNIDIRSFAHPIPVSGVDLWCKNESDNCTLGISVVGY